MRRIFASLFLSGMAGCLFPSLDALTSPDAAAPDGSIADVANDMTTNETSIVDAPADALDAQLPFCAAYADAGPSTFCQDFDSITDAAVLAPIVSSSVKFELDTSDYASPPASLRVTIPSSDSGAPLHGSVQVVTGIAPTTSTLDFDIKVTSVASSPVNVATLSFSSGREILLAIANTGLFLEEATPLAEGGALFNHPTIAVKWDSAWHHITLVLSLGAKTSTIVVDGTTYENGFSLLGNWAAIGTVTFSYGVAYTPTGPWTLGEDNIVLRLTP